MQKGNFSKIIIPSLTVFLSSACIMIIELVASRLIARHLGSSLYTWTSVIGVVLAGITIGNYLGGRIADKYKPRNSLSVLFCLASIACVVIIILNNIIGEWIWLWQLSWPMRVFSHITLVFLLPSVLLGTISPVVAKMALDSGLPTGRTVGDIYAFGAAGSIAGTFLAGFFLIAAMGTTAIIWTIAFFLLLMAVAYRVKSWPVYIWAVILVVFFFLSSAEVAFAQEVGSAMLVRQKADPSILYEDETPYCYVAVKQAGNNPNNRLFHQDTLIHSKITLNNITDLKYSYEQIHAAVTHQYGTGKEHLTTLIIGGGGYVFPRYIETVWPGSTVEVAEIDPGVTEAAHAGFGLSRETPIKTLTMDARNYIDQLCHEGISNKYDFIYEDALNDYSVPFQLTTKEFNEKLYTLLKDDGIYLVELIDVYETGHFLSAFVNTLSLTFPNVYVVTERKTPRANRNTFVVAASRQALDLSDLSSHYTAVDLDLWLLDEDEMQELKKKSDSFVLTDDFAPVENFLAPVVRQSSAEFLADKYRQEAKKYHDTRDMDAAIVYYQKMMDADDSASIEAYNDMALAYAAKGMLDKSIECFKNALKTNERNEIRQNMANIHFSLAVACQNVSQQNQAVSHFNLAISEAKKILEKNTNSTKMLMLIGDAYASMGQFKEAAQYFSKAVEVAPFRLEFNMKHIQAVEYSGDIDTAIKLSQERSDFFMKSRREQPAQILLQYKNALLQKKK
ncbi:MAG: fused MFS/spermidine synthase [Planctomycetota bacterium]